VFKPELDVAKQGGRKDVFDTVGSMRGNCGFSCGVFAQWQWRMTRWLLPPRA